MDYATLENFYHSLRTLFLNFCTFFDDNKYNILRYISLATVISFVLWILAIFFYVIWYYNYIPIISAEAPLYFDFSNDTLPLAQADLMQNGKYPLSRDQPYRVTIDLEVPESSVNNDLGMFMIHLMTVSSSNRVPDSVHSRPCLIRYKSRIVHWIQSIIYAFPVIIGLAEEKQYLEIILADKFLDNKENHLQSIAIEISNPNIQIYSARIRFEAKLSLLSKILCNWFFTSLLMGVIFIFICECVIISLVYFGIFIFSYFQEPKIEEQFQSIPSLTTEERNAKKLE